MGDEERVTPEQEHGIELPPFSIRHADLATFLEQCADEQSEQLANQRGRRTPEESDAIEEHVESELRLEPQHQVLEIGCGTGLLVRTCAPRVRRMVALDISAGLLRRARVNLTAHPNVRLLRADSVRLPFADGVFDRVLFSGVIPYCTREELVATLREMKRVCCPGGQILVGGISNPRRELTMILFFGGRGTPIGLLHYGIRRLSGRTRRGWYRPEELVDIAASLALKAEIVRHRRGMPFRHWRYDCRLTTPDGPRGAQIGAQRG